MIKISRFKLLGQKHHLFRNKMLFLFESSSRYLQKVINKELFFLNFSFHLKARGGFIYFALKHS